MFLTFLKIINMIESMIQWINVSMNQWMNKWINESMNEWINQTILSYRGLWTLSKKGGIFYD